MVPTRRFWWALALGIPIAAITTAIGLPWVVIVYDAILLILAYASFRLAPSTKELIVRREFDPVLSVRVPNRIRLRMTNEGVETIKARVRDEAPLRSTATDTEFTINLKPGERKDVLYSVTPWERGGDYFRGTYMRIECPFGLVERDVKLLTEQPVRVYPNVLALREFDLLKQQGRLREIGIRRSRMRGLGTEFESLRDYAEGDDFRKIDWKASARKAKLVVRQYEQERNQSVIVCLDVGRHMLSEVNGVTKLDHALDCCLMLLNAAAMAGDQIGLLVYSDVVKRYVPPRKGRNQVGIIIEALHDLLAEPVESDPGAAFAYLGLRWKRRSLIVAFTDVADPDQAKDVSNSFGSLSRRSLALLARVADPRVKEVLEKPVTQTPDMYLKASARMIVEDRQGAEAVLKTAGIHTLEAEPQDLAAALVSYYFMVKEKSLL